MLKKYLIPWLFLLLFISNSSIAVLPGEEEGACALPSASSSQTVPEELQSHFMKEFGDEDIGQAKENELINVADDLRNDVLSYRDSIDPSQEGGTACTYCAQAVFERIESGETEPPVRQRLMRELIEKTEKHQKTIEYYKARGKSILEVPIGSRGDVDIHASLQAQYPHREVLINGETAELLSGDRLYALYEIKNYEQLARYEQESTIYKTQYKFRRRLDNVEVKDKFYFNSTIKKWVKMPALEENNVVVGVEQDTKFKDE